jgi:hypothetical protein
MYVRVPFVPSSQKSLQALDQIPFQGNEHVCDLGSGNGKVLFHLRKKYPHMILTGYEIAILPYLYAYLKNIFLQTHIQFMYKNFLKADLRCYDTFFCYLMPNILNKVWYTLQQQKVHQQQKKKLITNTFHLHHITPDQTIPIPGSNTNLYIYTL